jgi:ATP-dependent protease ClpP protease subunit
VKEHEIILVGTVGESINLVYVVAAVNAAPIGTQALRIKIDSPGGQVEAGDNIYSFLNSMRPKYRLITEQIGFIGSIATKLFGVGDDRIALRGEEFGIHNPWAVIEGDADVFDETSKLLRQAEKNLTEFYMALTGLPEEAITPLMSATTFFDADMALSLGFATQVKDSLQIAANMKNKQSKFGKVIDALYALFNEEEQPKPKNMAVELEDGTQVFVMTEDVSKLEGVQVFTLDETGNPTQVSPPDGDYKLKDGRSIKVEKGVITQVVAAPTEQPPTEQAPEEEVAVLAKLDKLTEILQKQEKFSKAEVMAAIEEKFNALRNEIKTTHTPSSGDTGTTAEDAAEWDKAFKENRLNKIKKDQPELYARLHFARWKKMPN